MKRLVVLGVGRFAAVVLVGALGLVATAAPAPGATASCTLGPVYLTVSPSSSLKAGQAASVAGLVAYTTCSGSVTVKGSVVGPDYSATHSETYTLSGSGTLTDTYAFSAPATPGTYRVKVTVSSNGVVLSKGFTTFTVTA